MNNLYFPFNKYLHKIVDLKSILFLVQSKSGFFAPVNAREKRQPPPPVFDNRLYYELLHTLIQQQ